MSEDQERYNKATSLIFKWMSDPETATPKSLYRSLAAAGLLFTEDQREAERRAGREDAARDQTVDRQWVFPIDAKVDAVFADGSHRYWSTHCRHGRHDACSATEVSGTATRIASSRGRWPGTAIERKPAQCKTCSSPCLCTCHKDQ